MLWKTWPKERKLPLSASAPISIYLTFSVSYIYNHIHTVHLSISIRQGLFLFLYYLSLRGKKNSMGCRTEIRTTNWATLHPDWSMLHPKSYPKPFQSRQGIRTHNSRSEVWRSKDYNFWVPTENPLSNWWRLHNKWRYGGKTGFWDKRPYNGSIIVIIILALYVNYCNFYPCS
jgi:hypothetical protein